MKCLICKKDSDKCWRDEKYSYCVNEWKTDHPCIYCNAWEINDLHHVKSKKAHPVYKFKKWNLAPLCRRDHSITHSQGLNELAKNPRVTQWLFDHDWEFDSFLAKWVNKNQYAKVDDDF